MPTTRQLGLLSALIYPIQFERDPLDGVERVLRQVVHGQALGADAREYLEAIQAGLESAEHLAESIPQEHPEAAIRGYLAEVQKRLAGPL